MNFNDPTLTNPAIFWYWNDTPTHALIDLFLDECHAKGFHAVYVHPMPQSFRPADFFGGMELPYLSDAFFELIAYTCQGLKMRDMRMWLYDEGGWPSGMAGGKVVEENPDFGIWTLKKNGTAIAPVQLRDQVAYPDLMNLAATACFIRHTHERYKQYVGSEFGKTVLGMFTDEARLIGRVGTDMVPWSPLLPAGYLHDHGETVERILPLLFEGAPDMDATKLARRRYIETFSRLIAEGYYRPIGQWCRDNGIAFEGHHSGENDFSRHGQYFGNYFEQAKYYHIPGVDTIWRQIFPGQSGGNFVGLASSAAWRNGRRIALSESCGVYGNGITIDQMKWVAMHQIVRGVNKIGIMAALLSARGGRRFSIMSDFSPRNPIWQDIDLYTAHTRNAAHFSCRGVTRPRVGIFYRPELTDETRSAAFNDLHEAISDYLYDRFVSHMYVDETDLAGAVTSDGVIAIGNGRISLIIVHADGPLSPVEIETLEKLAMAGVRVVHIDGEEQLFTLDVGGLASVRSSPGVKNVRLLHLHEDAWEGMLFFNQGEASVTFPFGDADACQLKEVVIDPTRPDWLLPLRAIGGKYELTLQAGETRAFESIAGSQTPVELCGDGEVIEVANWSISVKERLVIGDDIVMQGGTPQFQPTSLGDYSAIDPTFSGTLRYKGSFNVRPLQSNARYLLDLGAVYYAAEIFLNGKSAGRRAWAPYWLDITAHVRAGANDILVCVTNTMANQWLEAAQLEKDLKQHGNMYLKTSLPFMRESLHAGLEGPVRIYVYR